MSDGFNFILNKIKDSTITDIRQQSYTLATIEWETGNTFQPVREWGTEEYLKSKPYYPFVGMGYTQLTWKNNYDLFSKILRIDLITHPELAMIPENAWKICEIGMTQGLFTGKKLDDYFNEKITDWFNARRIINGLDRAEKIAERAQEYMKSIDVNNYPSRKADEIERF